MGSRQYLTRKGLPESAGKHSRNGGCATKGANSSKGSAIKRDFCATLWDYSKNHTISAPKGGIMDTDLKFALTTVVAVLAMICAFSFTAVMH